MLMFAYLIQLNNKWKKSNITIISLANTEEEKQQLVKRIAYSIKESRIQAKIEVLVKDGSDIAGQLIAKSKHSDLVFSGLARHMHHADQRIKTIDRIVASIKAVAFVQNNGMSSEIPVIFGKKE